MTGNKSSLQLLEEQGWSRQFVASEPRLSEAVQMYQELGFEVHLEPLAKEPECKSCAGPEEEEECRVCFEGVEDQYKIIFTRPGKSESKSEDDPF